MDATGAGFHGAVGGLDHTCLRAEHGIGQAGLQAK